MASACSGAILAGGDATRMGGVRKGLLTVGGRRMIDRVASVLTNTTREIVLVANDPIASEWLPGVRVVADVRPGNGSLGGLHAALAHIESSVLVVAWDMPFVTPELLGRLRDLGDANAALVDAVVPLAPRPSAAARPQPLCAYYTRACLPAIERRLDRGDRRIVAMLDDLHVRWLEGSELAAYGDSDVLFANVNTRDDLARATARSGAGA